MRESGWNHNTHYHPLVLRVVPPGCARALDVGCGQGQLARKLAAKCGEVIAIDSDPETLSSTSNSGGPVSFIEGDVMTYPFALASFDLITAVATLQHLPLTAALARFNHLLRPGGTLAVIGLHRLSSPADYAFAAAAVPVSWMVRKGRPQAATGAPLRQPVTTLRAIRAISGEQLPGSVLRRRLFFRYSLIWRRPQ